MKPLELVAWREKQGLSQMGLARALGVNTATLFRWETGRSVIPPYLGLALKALEVLTPPRLRG